MKPIKAQAYIDNLTANGIISFTAKEILKEMNLTSKAVERAISRLKQQKEIVSLTKGFYLILTPEFRSLGCLPPDYFIDNLMCHWKEDYYVGLLSAALYVGAAHQQPQVFQVVTTQYHPALHCGQVKIEFIKKKTFANARISQLKTHTGSMIVSTPETTMMDLVSFIRRSGGISHVATLLDELAESVEPSALKSLLEKNNERTWMQRLGYLLESLGHADLASIICQHLQNQKINIVPLVPYSPMAGLKRNRKWRIVINATVESDVYDSD